MAALKLSGRAHRERRLHDGGDEREQVEADDDERPPDPVLIQRDEEDSTGDHAEGHDPGHDSHYRVRHEVAVVLQDRPGLPREGTTIGPAAHRYAELLRKSAATIATRTVATRICKMSVSQLKPQT